MRYLGCRWAQDNTLEASAWWEKAIVGMAQKAHEQYTVPQRWYQSKRLPLYFVVGGTFAGKRLNVEQLSCQTFKTAFWMTSLDAAGPPFKWCFWLFETQDRYLLAVSCSCIAWELCMQVCWERSHK